MSESESDSDRSIREGATRRPDQQMDTMSDGEDTHTGDRNGHGQLLNGTKEAVNGLELDNDTRISDAELDDDEGGLFGSGSEDEVDDVYVSTRSVRGRAMATASPWSSASISPSNSY